MHVGFARVIWAEYIAPYSITDRRYAPTCSRGRVIFPVTLSFHVQCAPKVSQPNASRVMPVVQPYPDRGITHGINTNKAIGSEQKMKKITILIVAVVLTLSVAGTGLAQRSQDLKQLNKQIELLQERQAEIQKELKEIKSLLQALQQAVSAKPQEVILNVETLPFKGDQNARLTIVEFSDYQ